MLKKPGAIHEASHSRVTLSETERASLQTIIHAGKANARTFTRAHVLLKVFEGRADLQICEAFAKI